MTTPKEPKVDHEAPKREYQAPKLVVLGTVRELTGTDPGSVQEAFGFPAPRN